ncbi:MAG: hypothetical protein ACC645_01880 [Pirellulales bacterium]
MADIIRIRDLTPAEVAQLLKAGGSDVDEHEAAAIQNFIEDLRGIENAWAAVEVLDKFKDAA